jgi:hypothetical protein
MYLLQQCFCHITLKCDRVITVIFSLIPLLGVKIIYLVDRTDLFKISSFVLGGKATVRSRYSSLERTRTERQKERENQ